VKARAPGKVVMSGAYAVLEGAPAVVTAVDRYVEADTSRPAELLTPEVKAVLRDKKAPWFDASALRSERGKLGLGSSAAILVASYGALIAEEKKGISEADLRAAVLEPCLAAHKTAQGGGSGIDVAAAVLGGTLIASKGGKPAGTGPLVTRSIELPAGLHIEVLFAGAPASTSELVGKVRAFKARSPHSYGGVMENLILAAQDAERAFEEGSAHDVIRALRDQLRGLTDLGEHAGIRIVTREIARLADAAIEDDAVVIPAGAGGGDVSLYLGENPPSARLVAAFDAERQLRLGVTLGARGLHLVEE
jgi:phosphomevalonate kinase